MRSGFVAVVGRPNAGKSSLLNYLVEEKIALVSHKSNATRKRSNIIVMQEDTQIIFVDTPGIHKREKLLNQFMLEEVMKAIGDCDLVIFLAPVVDELIHYERFLELNGDKPHIVILTKIDLVSNQELLEKLNDYSKYQNKFLELLPISTYKSTPIKMILESIAKYIPQSPYLYDPEILTTENVRDIYKEYIRESVFENVSDEIPYESDVLIEKIEELPKLDRVFASIIVEKSSQKMVVIGKDGATIKRIGKYARELICNFSGKKVYLELFVKVKKGWSKDRKSLMEFGYDYKD
jgi:GTP-binding protein Era